MLFYFWRQKSLSTWARVTSPATTFIPTKMVLGLFHFTSCPASRLSSVILPSLLWPLSSYDIDLTFLPNQEGLLLWMVSWWIYDFMLSWLFMTWLKVENQTLDQQSRCLITKIVDSIHQTWLFYIWHDYYKTGEFSLNWKLFENWSPCLQWSKDKVVVASQ